jgi:hypothetical protein
MAKLYKLTASDGTLYASKTPGLLGGYKGKKIYGRLDCRSAIRHLPGYAASRVFFADEEAAIAAGYRPCAKCMPDRYEEWKSGGTTRTSSYPWHKTPPVTKDK